MEARRKRLRKTLSRRELHGWRAAKCKRRGQFSRGTFAANGAPGDCQTYPPSGCVPIRWPGWSTATWHEDAGKQPVTGYEHYWFGSLSVGMRDATGLMYMRNRYYDAQTGQFTQTDPIGLAGGLNTYGFAAGDPVSYSDPYGLCPKEMAEISPMMCAGYDIMHTFAHGLTLPEEPWLRQGISGTCGTPGTLMKAQKPQG